MSTLCACLYTDNDLFLESEVRSCLLSLLRVYSQEAIQSTFDFSAPIPGVASFGDLWVPLYVYRSFVIPNRWYYHVCIREICNCCTVILVQLMCGWYHWINRWLVLWTRYFSLASCTHNEEGSSKASQVPTGGQPNPMTMYGLTLVHMYGFAPHLVAI